MPLQVAPRRGLLAAALLTPLLGLPAHAQAPGRETPPPRGGEIWDRADPLAGASDGRGRGRDTGALGPAGGTSAATAARVHRRGPAAGAPGRGVSVAGGLRSDGAAPSPGPRRAQVRSRDDRTDPPEIGDRASGRTGDGIQDNSFLIEEAYNQEAGVVQSIGALRRQGRDWFFAFIQEFPVGGQAHQLSYTLPLLDLRGAGQKASGFGDVLLNYRYQALYENDAVPGVAPRISLILPTGSERKGLGSGSFGVQANVAASKGVGDRVTLHANAGATSLFGVRGRSPTGFNLGGSAVLAATRDFNLLFEVLGEQFETVNENRRIDRARALTVSPGLRYAFNFTDAQLVLGLAAPVRFAAREKSSYGAIFYLSFEGKLPP